MRYNILRRRPTHFLSFTGLTVEEYGRLVAQLEPEWVKQRTKRLIKNNPDRKRKIGGGRHYGLPALEDRLLLTLVWTRTYPSHTFLEYLFGIDESTVSRTIRETILLLQDRFIIPDPRKQKGRKKIKTLEELAEFLPKGVELGDILTDGTEQAIPRPLKKLQRKKYHSGKKKRFTVKTQVTTTKNGYILHVSRASPGRRHDYRIFKESILPQLVPKHARLYGDSGYQGIRKDFPALRSVIPYKRTRNHTILTRSEKIRNTKQRRIRVKIEHAISRLKKYRVLADIYRHSLQNYNQTFRFIANVANFRMIQRAQAV